MVVWGLGLVLERGLGAVAVASRHALFQRLLQALPRLALVLGPGRKKERKVQNNMQGYVKSNNSEYKLRRLEDLLSTTHRNVR